MLIHYSTDFVSTERSIVRISRAILPRPRATTAIEAAGEFAADAPLHYVLRVESLFGGRFAKSSIDRILDTIQRGEPARVFGTELSRRATLSTAEATARLLTIRPPAGCTA